MPYIDRGPRGDGGSSRPRDRKIGVMLFSLIMTAGLVITFLGAFFRGPGYGWTCRGTASTSRSVVGAGDRFRPWVTGNSTRWQEPKALTKEVLRELRTASRQACRDGS